MIERLLILLRKDKVRTWICGHIHQNFDYITNGGTRLVGNQYGKPRDNVDDYSKEFVVKIEEDDDFLQGKKFQYCSEPILNDGKNDYVLVT